MYGGSSAILVAGAAQALTVVPTDLNPGDEYRLVFVTDDIRDATSTNIADYNNFVTNDVIGSQLEMDLMEAGLMTDWFAIASTETVSAIENTSTDPADGGVPIYLITGERVANDYEDLWDATIQTAIDTTPRNSGTQFPNIVWTGSLNSGEQFTSQWLGDTSGATIVGVSVVNTTGDWITNNLGGSIAPNRFYGMSEVLTVPQAQSTPEPSSLLGFITLGGMFLGTAVRRARK